MYSLTINKKPYTIPEYANELTIGQFIAISKLDKEDEMGMLRILLKGDIDLNGDPDQIHRELTGAFTLIQAFTDNINLTLSSGMLLIEPKRINVLGLDIEIKPNFINTLPYWGYIHTKSAIQARLSAGKDEKFNATDLIPGILAHNLYALVTKSVYNEAKAEEFIEVVNDINFVEAMQLGNFFLLQQKKLWTSKGKRWRMILNRWRSKLASKYLINTEQ